MKKMDNVLYLGNYINAVIILQTKFKEEFFGWKMVSFAIV